MEKPGVAGAAFEHPLEGVAEDPAGVGVKRRSPLGGGLDTLGGAEARGQLHKASVVPASLLAGMIEPNSWD